MQDFKKGKELAVLDWVLTLNQSFRTDHGDVKHIVFLPFSFLTGTAPAVLWIDEVRTGFMIL